ncbi:MAG TPA: alpha/beta hydrolase [Alphaproteobacteria bacterium]|jgi:pimeloyl-ACP methyl ester carboxylesterase|nr:alpha/beta hydrolase [Alphaproteobacteria bacterium]
MQHRLLRIPSGLDLPDEGPLDLAVEIFWPDRLDPSGPVPSYFCLPGGSINRHYYNLQAPGDDSFSFAAMMAKQGAITFAVDHLGVGDSDSPRDGFLLTPDRLAQANANVARKALNGLREGSLIDELPPLKHLVSIGVGHSMGGMLTVVQQALAHQHDGLLLMGFANAGLISHLPEPAHHLAGRPEAVKAEIEAVARTIYPEAYQRIAPSPEASAIFQGASADRVGVQAIKRTRDNLLVIGGLQSMIPGSIRPALDTVDVPVLLGLGDRDIAGPPHEIPASFPNSPDVTLAVLPETGHCQFIFPSRDALFRRIGEWTSFVIRRKGWA